MKRLLGLLLAMMVMMGATWKLPMRIRNSPTKLPVPGMPREATEKNSMTPGR